MSVNARPLRARIVEPGDDARPTPVVGPVVPGWASVEGAATYTSLSDDSIRRAIDSGELAASKVRGRILIAFADLDSWIRRHPIGGGAR